VIDARGVIGHAEVRIGGAIVMLFDGDPNWPATPAFLRLYVEDARAVYRQGVEAGGVGISEVTHLVFGDLVGRGRGAAACFEVTNELDDLFLLLSVKCFHLLVRKTSVGMC
jgi:hypothetical protein